MQNNVPSFNLSNAVLLGLATILSNALTAFFTYVFTRPKQSADIHKTEAEAQDIQSSIMMKIYGRLDDYENTRRRLNEAIADLENRNFDLEYAGRQKDAENQRLKSEMDILDRQVQKARARGFLAEDRMPGSPNPAA